MILLDALSIGISICNHSKAGELRFYKEIPVTKIKEMEVYVKKRERSVTFPNPYILLHHTICFLNDHKG